MRPVAALCGPALGRRATACCSRGPCGSRKSLSFVWPRWKVNLAAAQREVRHPCPVRDRVGVAETTPSGGKPSDPPAGEAVAPPPGQQPASVPVRDQPVPGERAVRRAGTPATVAPAGTSRGTTPPAPPTAPPPPLTPPPPTPPQPRPGP